MNYTLFCDRANHDSFSISVRLCFAFDFDNDQVVIYGLMNGLNRLIHYAWFGVYRFVKWTKCAFPIDIQSLNQSYIRAHAHQTDNFRTNNFIYTLAQRLRHSTLSLSSSVLQSEWKRFPLFQARIKTQSICPLKFHNEMDERCLLHVNVHWKRL